MTTTQKVVALCAGVLLALPLAASAEDAAVNAEAQSIVSQIRTLQAQLKTIIASSTPVRFLKRDGSLNQGQALKRICESLKRDLKVGTQGDDVRDLQLYLKNLEDSGFSGEATGFFGPLTASAVAKLQVKLGIASSTDGRVGPTTRAFLRRECGKGLQKEDRPATTTPATTE